MFAKVSRILGAQRSRATAVLWLCVAYLIVLLGLAGLQPDNYVGDEGEYLAVALRLGRLQQPSLDEAEFVAIESELAEDGVWMLAPESERRDGRRDFWHFYAYSAVAAPFVSAVRGVGLHPRIGFLLLNALLLAVAAYVVAMRLHWTATCLLFVGPIIWWVGRAHTEPFTFALLAIALALIRERPGISMVCLGAAAAQNPPIAALVVALPVALLVTRDEALREWGFWAGASIGGAIALCHPVYYWLANGAFTAMPNRASTPTVQELGAVIWDANVGLLPNHPWFAVAVVVAVGALATRAPHRLLRAGPLVAGAGAAAFLLAFSQTVNFNSAASPGVARYALWLVPLAVPFFAEGHASIGPRWRRCLVFLTLVGCVWSLTWFHRGRPEGHDRPTRLARVLWTRWPSATNPLPEVFSERLSGSEVALAPIATAGCEKILLSGNVRFVGMWPIPCPPAPTPSVCRTPDRLCYANHRNGAYEFVTLPRRGFEFPAGGQRTWPRGFEAVARELLERVPWSRMRRVSGLPTLMVRTLSGSRAIDGFVDDERLFLAVVRPGPEAVLALRPPRPMQGAFVLAERPLDRLPVAFDGSAGERWELRVPESELAILYLE